MNMKKILISLLLLLTVLVSVSCGGKCEKAEIAETETDTVENVYLVKVLKTYLDSIPEITYEKVDVIVNDTIRHKDIMRVKPRYSFSVEYKYCIVNDIVGTDTVWHRIMVEANKRLYERLAQDKLNDSVGYDYVVEENSQRDAILNVTSSINQRPLRFEDRAICVYYDNEIDSVNPLIDADIKETWAGVKRMAKEHNSK